MSAASPRTVPARLLAFLIGLLLTLLCAPQAQAANRRSPVFVSPPAAPTEVGVGMYLVGLSEVSSPNESFQTFRAELFMDIEWEDPRLAHGDPKARVYVGPAAEEELGRIWTPDLQFENETGERNVESRELKISPRGHVAYMERLQATFTADVDLIRFPFDRQSFTIKTESFAWDHRHVHLVTLEGKSGFNDRFETLEWHVDGVASAVSEKAEIRSPEAFSVHEYTIQASRRAGYYLYKIVVPLLLVVAFNGSIFWMPGEPASSRMEKVVIALLTVVAFNQVVASNLPRMGELTFMDGVVYVAFGSVGLTMIATLMTQWAEHAGQAERVARIDRVGQIAYPLTFVGAIAVLYLIYTW